ncbi:MAG: beta-glucuronidase [Actinomycetota bacterium]|nr:beta-glucuronidase [Actinomycetota bacterium]
MLPPRETPTRERKPLVGLWRFALDPDGVGRARGWADGLPDAAREMPVPASYNDVFPEPELRNHVGEAWYETDVRVPSRWQGQRIVLRFESATHRAAVFVNGRPVVEHEGGYTPFEADVSDLVRPGAADRVTVVVDNRLSWQSIPPGFVEQTEDGPRQRYFHDFFNYAGLHRPVWLYTTPEAHIRDVTLTPRLDGQAGVVGYRVEREGAQDVDVCVTLLDADGEEVARATGGAGELRVEEPQLWRPGHGYLYKLVVELRGHAETVVDCYSLPVGIRTVEIDGSRFLINGEPFYFKGFGKHEDGPIGGKRHDDALMVHDFALMKWLGANSFRTSHYPYAEAVLEYADRQGIVVIAETAAVGLNASLGGVLGGVSFKTFSEETVNDETRQVHAQAIRELIARDKNHPCVVIWSIANEPESWTPESRAYFEPLVAEARRADPTRPVGYANFMQATPDRDTICDLFDVQMLNRYQGWYAETGDLAAAERDLEAELTQWVDRLEKPIIFTEYGGDAVAGLHGVSGGPWTEEYQAELLAMFHRVFDRFAAVVGEQVWHFADFATAAGVMRADGNKKGVFTRERRPKAAAHLLRRRWRGRR